MASKIRWAKKAYSDMNIFLQNMSSIFGKLHGFLTKQPVSLDC